MRSRILTDHIQRLSLSHHSDALVVSLFLGNGLYGLRSRAVVANLLPNTLLLSGLPRFHCVSSLSLTQALLHNQAFNNSWPPEKKTSLPGGLTRDDLLRFGTLSIVHDTVCHLFSSWIVQ